MAKTIHTILYDSVRFVVSNQWEKANVLNLLQIAKNEGWSYEIVKT